MQIDELFDVRKTVGSQIERILSDFKITKTALCEAVKMSRPTLNKLLQGDVESKQRFTTHIAKLLSYFDMTADQLLYYEESIMPYQNRPTRFFTLVGGINGAGKSSLSGVLKSQRRDLGIIVDPDLIAASLGGDTYEGGKAAVAKIDECLANGVNFTQETTLSGSYHRKVAKRAKAAGYTVRLFYVGIDSMEDSIMRIENRVRRGGHDIPREDIVRRYENRFSSLKAILPFCDEAFFFDNNNGFAQVAQYLNGELILLGERKPKWLSEIQDALK